MRTSPNLPPTEAAVISQLGHLAGLMPYLEHEIRAMQTHIINVTLQELQKGELTPDAALLRWQEIAVGQDILKRFQRKVRIGQTVSERNADKMRLNEDFNG